MEDKMIDCQNCFQDVDEARQHAKNDSNASFDNKDQDENVDYTE